MGARYFLTYGHDPLKRYVLVAYDTVKNAPQVLAYIQKADDVLRVMGFTEHNLTHVTGVAQKAGEILAALGCSEHDAELARIAGFLHDIGNVVNRADHAQSGAVMAFRILDQLGMAPEDIATIISAIGNHDEATACPVSPIAAALILADKSDVRRTRVRNCDTMSLDIHDRVNYAVTQAKSYLSEDKKEFVLKLHIDRAISSVMDYFEIFLSRMLLCRRAAESLGLQFKLIINGQVLL